jgi:hypothetical protein
MLWIVPAIMNPQHCSLVPKCIASNDREAGGKQSRKKARLKEKEKKRKYSGEWKMSKKNQEYVNSNEEHFKLWSAGGADAGAGGGGKIVS